MKKWTITEILLSIVFNTVVILLTYFILHFVTRLIHIDVLPALALYCALPAICSALFVHRLKSKQRRLIIAEGILIGCLSLLTAIFFIEPDLPFFNGEAFAFGMLFAFTHCIGLLIGSLFGYIVWYFTLRKLDI